MANDEKRREVAAELRRQIGYMSKQSKWYEDDIDVSECGNAAYRNIAASVERCGHAFRGNYIHICETLADLIDRPTCKIILARELRTAYGKPITGINGYILSCGHQAVGFAKPRYCPECGMEVGE